MTTLDDIISGNLKGGPAVPSVCSAHPDVLSASLRLAEELDRPLLVEATSNQVNQFGGYTGMQPSDFIGFVRSLCEEVGCDPGRVIFGGDHLGPQAWKDRDATEAMGLARDMLRTYVAAGFTKIHLDCSEGCAGEPAAVGDGLAATRAADLAEVCETVAPGACAYVIGTEVPPPGGARQDDEGIAPTPPGRARATLEAHREAFAERELEEAFERVRALVLQPGLEFAPAHVDHFDTQRADALSPILAEHGMLCFEAHSTDYQRPEVYPELARRHFAILKVGPALTFAWREALYALSHVQSWLSGAPHVSETMERLMTEDPKPWTGHYHGDADRKRLLRHFGYADRIRYYWAREEARNAVESVLRDLETAPRPLLEQYLPPATLARAETLDAPLPRAILMAHVQEALLPYYRRPE